MGRVFAGILVVIAAGAAALAAWWFQPWADYAPARIHRLNDEAYSRVAFRTMADILPHAVIQAQAPQPLPRADAPMPPVRYRWNGEERSLTDYVEGSETTGLMVLHRGEVVFEATYLGTTTEDRLTSWSVAKSFVAGLIAIAVEQGRIESLDDPVSVYATQYAGTDYGDTSIRHLLMMSTGMDFDEGYFGPSDIRRLFFRTFYLQRSIDRAVARIERLRPAGETLNYQSPNSHVLSAVVRAAFDDASLAAIVEEQIWTPLGMIGDADWSQDMPGPDGAAIGYCCLNARLEDYARFGQLHLQDGVWNGERLFPEGWVEQASQPNAPFQAPGAGPYEGRGYGLHLWIPENADREYFMAGVAGQYVWVDPVREVVIARTAADYGWLERRAESFAVMRAIARAASGE